MNSEKFRSGKDFAVANLIQMIDTLKPTNDSRVSDIAENLMKTVGNCYGRLIANESLQADEELNSQKAEASNLFFELGGVIGFKFMGGRGCETVFSERNLENLRDIQKELDALGVKNTMSGLSRSSVGMPVRLKEGNSLIHE